MCTSDIVKDIGGADLSFSERTTQCYYDCNGQTCGLKFRHVFQKGFDATNDHQLQGDTKLNFDTEGNRYGLYLFFYYQSEHKTL
jgi:hypothetical protein